MRIGIMCLASWGGSARIATQLATKLAHRGHRVHLFTRTPPPFGDRIYTNGVVLHTVTSDPEADIHPAELHIDWSAEDYQTILSRIFDVIVAEGLDVLHFHYAVPFAFLAAEVRQYLGRAAPVLIGTLHGTDVSVYGRDPANRLRLSHALRRMDALTTVSTSHAWLAADLFRLPIRPQVVPNFIDLSGYQHQGPYSFRRSYLMSEQGGKTRNGSTSTYNGKQEIRSLSKPRIVHVSNFRPVKDTQSMARIFLGIRQQMEAELWLIGDGPEMGAATSILQQGQVERDVRYWGLQHNVAPLLAQTDLLLMTSLSESFCLAALEAMACGIPVLATRVGGVPEVVIDRETGFLFPVGDHDAAVRTAVNLLSNPTQHQAMRDMAGQHAARYDHNKIVPVYENLYQKLLYRKFRKSSQTITWATQSLPMVEHQI